MADVLEFSAEEDFTAERLNAAFRALNLRLKGIEGQTIDYEDAIAQLKAVGLLRLDDAIRPVYMALTALSQLGAIFTTTSATAEVLGNGTKTLVVAGTDAARFAAAAYLVMQSADDPQLGFSGRLQSYDRATGALTVLVDEFSGPEGSTVSSWIISAGASFDLYRAYADRIVAAMRLQILGGVSSSLDTLGEIEARITALVGGASFTMDSFGEVEARINALVGTASAAADTLGELEAIAVANRAYAKKQAIIFG